MDRGATISLEEYDKYQLLKKNIDIPNSIYMWKLGRMSSSTYNNVELHCINPDDAMKKLDANHKVIINKQYELIKEKDHSIDRLIKELGEANKHKSKHQHNNIELVNNSIKAIIEVLKCINLFNYKSIKVRLLTQFNEVLTNNNKDEE